MGNTPSRPPVFHCDLCSAMLTFIVIMHIEAKATLVTFLHRPMLNLANLKNLG